MSNTHIEPTAMLAKQYGIARRKDLTPLQIEAAQQTLLATNPRLVHAIRKGEVVCGRALTREEFVAMTTKDTSAATCCRCRRKLDAGARK